MKNEPNDSIATSDDVSVPRHELWVMLLCTVRYAMGRRTYVVQEACELLEKYFKDLSEDQRMKSLEEISQELSRHASAGTTMGDACDHKEWHEVLLRLRELL